MNRVYYKYYNDKPLWEIKVPSTCYGVLRVPIPETAQEAVRAEWPEDRPQFWAPGIYRSEGPFYESRAWKTFRQEFKYNITAMWGAGSIGAPRTEPRFGTILEVEAKQGMGIGAEPPEFYPARVVYLPPDQRQRWRTDQVMALEVDIRPETRGLAYCGGPWPSLKARAAMAPEFADGQMDSYTGYGRRLLENKNPKPGERRFPIIPLEEPVLFVNGQPMFPPGIQYPDLAPPKSVWFERDQYFIDRNAIAIAQEFGPQEPRP